jgi:hypothetical protein
LAARHLSVQNKVVTKPIQEPDTSNNAQLIEDTDFSEALLIKPDTADPLKADTPLKDNNYIVTSHVMYGPRPGVKG